jgi:RNase P/RNase MRP subunit POP5
MTKLVKCTMCPWTLATETINPVVKELADAHLRYHGQQLAADVESWLETYDDEEDCAD